MRKVILFLLILIYAPIQSSAQKLELVESKVLFQNAVALSSNLLNSIFVVDNATNEILQIDEDLNIVSSLGGFGSNTENFDSPSDIFCNALNIYVTDKNNNRIQVFDKDLNFIYSFELAANQQEEKIYYPISCAVSASGDYFILDSDNNRVVKFNSNGRYLLQFGNYESGKFQLFNPQKILTNGSDKIFVLQRNQLTVFDFFGSGISKMIFDDDIISGFYSENKLIINSTDKISIINTEKGSSPEKFELSEYLENDEIRQALITKHFLYILTSRKIYKFLLK